MTEYELTDAFLNHVTLLVTILMAYLSVTSAFSSKQIGFTELAEGESPSAAVRLIHAIKKSIINASARISFLAFSIGE